MHKLLQTRKKKKFSSIVILLGFLGGNSNKSNSDKDLHKSHTFLEVTLYLLVLDCRSSKLGNNDFFLLGLADIVFKGDAADDEALCRDL